MLCLKACNTYGIRTAIDLLCWSEAIASDEAILQAIACNGRIDEGWSLRLTEVLVSKAERGRSA
ncbi:hypothetical protein [Acetobacteroides hydrogenigenes]|uniref:hypothetical protein n=1 Tax=Acetobacteroides hydrogenigenes TaxID=979970 RepID=UPI001044CA96|nr:hypothetical protein [Acetobacteroides hydrogenigenes]